MNLLFRPLRRLYDWVLSWSKHPAGSWALLGLAFAEASFFPVPPDVLQIALGIAKPKKSFFYAAVSSVGSVGGAFLGYAIGYFLFESVGRGIVQFYNLQGPFETVGRYYEARAFFWILLAAFTPIPYKVFTLAAGVYHQFVPLAVLAAASAIGRPARFFLVGGLIYFFGARIERFIDRYFNWLTLAFGLLLAGGFLAAKMLHE